MVIQRWQNLLLLIAVVLMCIFCLTPYATHTTEGGNVAVYASDAPVFLVINIVIAALLVLGIFYFKNLKRQMTVTILSIVLLCASIVTCGFILYTAMPDATLVWTGGVVLLIVALICAVSAYRFMRKDRNLLRSYDRLR
ncbi:MAG: DUF4293 domain-containing protein [Bacteroidales bacterium]|nr:DUF4293 domain-containing protein [Bacteroidales bacterium]